MGELAEKLPFVEPLNVADALPLLIQLPVVEL